MLSQKKNALKNMWIGITHCADDCRQLPDAFLQKDPAARSRWEVLFCYPGVRALLFHRMAHAFWQNQWHFTARAVSEWGRFLSGIEIHPGATIGKRVIIDHGMGVVIGETAEVEDDVLIYQNVTLGGTSLTEHKRHPTVRAGATIGVGAAVLGNIEVGTGAKVGAGAVVLKSVAPRAVVAGIPAQPVRPGNTRPFAPHLVPVPVNDKTNHSATETME